MLPLRRAQAWRRANSALLILVLATTLVPTDWFWSAEQLTLDWMDNADKWLHVFAFVFLAVWFAGQHEARAYWRIGIGLIGFGLLIEGCQWLVGYRTAEWLDIVADTIGIVTGLALALAGLGGWASDFEAWLVGRAPGTSDE